MLLPSHAVLLDYLFIRGTSIALRTSERQARAGPLIAKLKTRLEETLRQQSRKSSLVKVNRPGFAGDSNI